LRKVRVPLDLGDRSYDIVLGYDVSRLLGEEIRKVSRAEKVMVVTDSRINRLHGKAVMAALVRVGFSPTVVQVPYGEQHKTVAQIGRIYDHLVQHRFERSSLLVALGGGVIGDMTGFAAATFLRGIAYVQCPTTVVAQVDAAIGGKTGVDHPKGKNLIGAIYQPSLVVVDPLLLVTLPKREFVSGLAEVVKYGVICDPQLFRFMEKNVDAILARDPKSLTYCIRRSVEIKAAVVVADERELGLRKILNYGHTFGHAIETVTGYRRYKHGEAVAIGMIAASFLADRLGVGNSDLIARQASLLAALGLPTRFPRLNPDEIMKVLYSDKKVVGGEVHCILPEKMGSVSVQKVERDRLEGVLRDLCLS